MAIPNNRNAHARGTRTALALGATGGVGGETAAALLRHGWHVKALARDRVRAAANRNVPAGIEWLQGDALDRDSVIAAARGAALIVHAVNLAGYRNWSVVLPMIDNSIAAARASGALILFPAPSTITGRMPSLFSARTRPSNRAHRWWGLDPVAARMREWPIDTVTGPALRRPTWA